MRNWNIGSKVALLAFLPTLIVSILLGSYFAIQKFHDVNVQLERLGNSMVEQLSPAAKYALLENNVQVLQGLTNAALENSRVLSAAIFNSSGKLLAFSGPDNLMPNDLTSYKKANLRKNNNYINFIQPLTTQQITISDYDNKSMPTVPLAGKNLGWIALVVSSTAVSYIKIQTLLVTAIIIILGLILSLLIIRLISRSITTPIIKINKAVQSLYNSNYSYKINGLSGKEFSTIFNGLNKIQDKLKVFEDTHQNNFDEETNDLKQTLEKIEIQNIELNIALKNARRDNRKKSEFIASLSHEIRTPMSSIIGFTNLLLESDLSKYQQEYLVTIQKSANTLLAIINDILDFSKIEAGKFKLDNIPFDLTDTIDEVLQSIAPEAQRKNLELIPLIHVDIPQKVIGDPLRLKQILTNLVYNAIKFTEEGSVSLKTELIKISDLTANIQFSVVDTGIGLTEKEKKTLFKAFSQADISVARKFGGTGLGLVISKQFIEQMGGSIHISSEIGIGTTLRFNVRFNLLNKDYILSDVNNVLDQHVLVYESHPLSLEALQQALSPRLKKLSTASSISELNDRLIHFDEHSEHPDHIILSLTKSELYNTKIGDLIHTCKQIHSIPITALLNNANETIIEDLSAYGVFNYVLKPISAKKIIDAISSGQTYTPASQTSGPIYIADNTAIYSNLNVLIAEDNPSNLKLICCLFEKTGIVPDTAIDGQQAQKSAAAKKYDIIFLDLHMPNLPGIHAASLIRTQCPCNQETPIIALSAYISESDKVQLYNSGFNELLIKPVDATTLEAIIKKWSNCCVNTNSESSVPIVDKLIPKESNLPLDLQRTIELSASSEPLALEIIQMFLKELPTLKRNMAQFYSQKQWDDLRGVIHKIHGSSKFCAMALLQKTAHEFEEALVASNTEQFAALYAQINDDIVNLHNYVQSHLPELEVGD